MKTSVNQAKRRFLGRGLAVMGGVLLAGCDRLSDAEWFGSGVLEWGQRLSYSVHKLLGRKSMAQEFTESDISPFFRANGNDSPNNPAYQTWVKSGFADWALTVDGLVETPVKLSLADLRAAPSRTQITRHDCVEGWSAIGKWTGVPLAHVLSLVKPKPAARYAVFHCSDPMESDGSHPYYESIDMDDAYHAQTILAYALNGKPLPVANGAPIRLRVERQLGYKQAKYIERIELVSSFAQLHGGNGGYWEDQGYQWYAGI